MITVYMITILTVSLASVTVYGVDKLRAIEGRTRIPENVLIAFSAMGGVLGTILGMIFFNHKSNMSHKWHFFTTIIVSFLIQLALVFACAGMLQGGEWYA